MRMRVFIPYNCSLTFCVCTKWIAHVLRKMRTHHLTIIIMYRSISHWMELNIRCKCEIESNRKYTCTHNSKCNWFLSLIDCNQQLIVRIALCAIFILSFESMKFFFQFIRELLYELLNHGGNSWCRNHVYMPYAQHVHQLYDCIFCICNSR